MKGLLAVLLCLVSLLIPDACHLAIAARPVAAAGPSGKVIKISAPPVPQAVSLLRAPQSRALRGAGVGAEFTPWRSPELLRVLVANKAVDAVIAPLPTAAVLSSRGIPCRVLAVYSAPLWIVSTEARAAELDRQSPAASFAALRGQEVLLPFGPGDMPELAMRALALKMGLELKLRHSGSALEAANLLRRGLADFALLPEPAATLITEREAPAGRLGKRLALRDVWLQVFPEQTSMPTAALVMAGPLAEDGEACRLLRASFLEGLAWAEQNPEAALRLAQAEYPELGGMLAAAPASGKEVFRSLGVLDGPGGVRAARFVLERIAAVSEASVGGRLPDAEFWGLLDAAE